MVFKLNRTGSVLNRRERLNFNENWDNLEGVISDRGLEILSEEWFKQYLDTSGIKHREEVATFADLPSSDSLNTVRGVVDDNKIYIKKESGWVAFQTIDISKINEVSRKIDDITLNAKELGVVADGQTLNSDSIQAIFDQYDGNIYFPDGEYILDKGLSVKKSNTHLTFSPNAKIRYLSESTAVPFLKFEGNASQTGYIVSDNIKSGEKIIKLSYNASAISPGDWIKLSSNELYHSSRDDYTKREFHKVVSVSQNIIEVDSPIFYAYNTTSYTARVVKQELLKEVSVRNIQAVYDGDAIARGVEFSRCLNPSIHGSSIRNFERHNIFFDNCVAPLVSENYTESNREDTGLSYGIFVGSCQNATITDNRIYSKRTAIDISYMSRKSIVSNNTLLKGDLNTHGCVDVVMNGNSVSDGYILLRGTMMTVGGNSVSARYLSATGGMIFMDEMAQMGLISISDNILIGHSGNIPANGIYGGSVNGMKNIVVKGNIVKNVINGISFYRGIDTNAPINDITISDNHIKTEGGDGIIGSRAEDFIVNSNIIEGVDSATGVGIDFVSTTKVLKNIIISNNKIKKYDRPIRTWSTYENVIVTGNISSECGRSIDNQVNSTNTVSINNISVLEV